MKKNNGSQLEGILIKRSGKNGYLKKDLSNLSW